MTGQIVLTGALYLAAVLGIWIETRMVWRECHTRHQSVRAKRQR